MQIKPEDIISLYKKKGVDLENIIGSPLMSVEKTNDNFTFNFANIDLELNQVAQRIHHFRLAIKMQQAELVYPTFTIGKNKYKIDQIDLETNLVELEELTNQEKKIITIDAARHHQHAEIINRLQTAETCFYDGNITKKEVLSEINFIFSSIKRIYSFAHDLNFHCTQVLVRIIQKILHDSNFTQIESNMQSWDPLVLQQNQNTISVCMRYISQFTNNEIQEITLISNKLSHFTQKINYKLETLNVINSAIQILDKYQECSNPFPHLWFDLSSIKLLIEHRYANLKSSHSTIPEMIKIFAHTAFLIEKKLKTASRESTMLFPQILEQLQDLKILSKPNTAFAALDKLELILENLKLKNMLHIQRSLHISIYQKDIIEQLNICIPELHTGETFLTLAEETYLLTRKKYDLLAQKRLNWLQEVEIEQTQDLEKLSKTNPEEFYDQTHRILRQRQLSQLMHQEDNAEKQSLIEKLIEKLRIEEIS